MVINPNKISIDFKDTPYAKGAGVSVQGARDGDISQLGIEYTKDCAVQKEMDQNMIYTGTNQKEIADEVRNNLPEDSFDPADFINQSINGRDARDIEEEGSMLEEYVDSTLERAIEKVKTERKANEEALDKQVEKEKEKRDARLLAEYPQMLSQMALLLGAGMTVSHAWERIVVSYENRCAGQPGTWQEMPVYEEMRITYHQIKDGLGERRAYEQFGERIQLQAYRRFATLLVQNLRKGTTGLSKLLEKELQDAFDAQESYAKKRGEELQTKLLLPMMLMLGLVIVIIMIPAIASFQM